MAKRSKKGNATPSSRYRAADYPRPSVTVDIVVFTVVDTDLKVLLIKRGAAPFANCWALPGGFLKVADGRKQGEDLEDAAHRELAEETGLPQGEIFLEQLYTFGKAGRDPRTRVITVAYYALLPPHLVPLVHAGSDAREADWFSVVAEASQLSLAFDHDQILSAALERVRGKIDYAPLVFQLVPPTFTIGELRAVYEAIKGSNYDPGNFRRRFMRMKTDGIIKEAPGKRQTTSKPAKVYRFAHSR